MNKNIYYEQPLTERIRTIMRLEHLYFQAQATRHVETTWDTRSTINTLLDIQNVFARTDIKTEILKELERLSSVLETLEKNPNVDFSKLTSVLDEIDMSIDQIHAMNGPVGNQLKQNELLKSIKQRNTIPGGSCDFDLPSYHFWIEQPIRKRREDIDQWLGTFSIVLNSSQLILRLLRESAPCSHEIASDGFFQKSLDQSTPCHLVRVAVATNCPYYAEISGGKHRFSVRFMEMNMNDRDSATAEKIDFELACCTL